MLSTIASALEFYFCVMERVVEETSMSDNRKAVAQHHLGIVRNAHSLALPQTYRHRP